MTFSAQVQPSAIPGEGIGFGVGENNGTDAENITATIAFSPAAVDSLRGFYSSSSYASIIVPLTIAGTSHAGDTLDTGFGFVISRWLGGAGRAVADSARLLPRSPRGAGVSLPFRFNAYDLGYVTGAPGSAVTAALRAPFTFEGVGTSQIPVTCTPGSEREVLRIPVVGPDPTPTPPVPTDPAPTPAPVTGLNVALKGSATLKTLSSGSFPLTVR